MGRRLVDADLCSAGVQDICRYPGRLIIAPDPDLVAAQGEIVALVLVVKIQPDLVTGGIVRQVKGGDQAVGRRNGGVMYLVQGNAAGACPGKAGINEGTCPSVGITGKEVAAIQSQ